MTQKERYQIVTNYFSKKYPNPETELHYENAYQLLVAVTLSAQCTDKRVNKITPALFETFPDTKSLSQADFETVFALIKSCSFPNNKAKYIIAAAKMLEEEFSGQLPMDVKQLMRLPGVGRKTANVLTSVLDQQPNMAVDTHVFRVSARLGLTKNAKTPLAAEQQLTRHFSKDVIYKAHHWLILHGRYVCTARKPKCDACGLRDICIHYNKVIKPALEKAAKKK